jgi:hypothetical protein
VSFRDAAYFGLIAIAAGAGSGTRGAEAAAALAPGIPGAFAKPVSFSILEDYDEGEGLRDVARDSALFRALGIRAWRGSGTSGSSGVRCGSSRSRRKPAREGHATQTVFAFTNSLMPSAPSSRP